MSTTHADVADDTGAARTNGAVTRARPRRRLVRWLPLSWVVGLIVALAVAALGWQFALSHPQKWEARTQLLVVPQATLSTEDVPAYWETLSTGQVSATAAGIIASPQYQDEAADELGLTDDDTVVATVQVVPGTLLIEVVVDASDRDAAEQFADELPEQALGYVNTQIEPFEVSTLGSAGGTAELTGLSLSSLAAAVALAAIIAGLAAQQLVQQLVTVRRRDRR